MNLNCPAHRRHDTVIGAAFDRDAHLWPLARPERCNIVRQNTDTGSGLAAQLEDGTKSYTMEPSSAVLSANARPLAARARRI